MFPFAIVIVIVIVIALLALALIVGTVGAVRRGPNPSEGDKGTG